LNTFLNEEDQSIKAQFEKFAREQLAPEAQALESRQGNLKDFLQKVANKCLFAVCVPKEYGGAGGPFLHAILLAEAMGVYEPGFGLALAAQSMVIELIKRFGTDAQRSKYLPSLAAGELLATFAWREEDAQEPFFGTKTKIAEKPSGKLLSGAKRLVVNGRIAQLIVVLAALEAKDGQKSLGLWLTEPGTNQTIKIVENGPYIGLRSAYLDHLEFEGYAVSEGDRLGAGSETGAAEQQYEFGLGVGKTIMAAAAVGMLEGLLAEAAEAMRTKELHGTPASQSQALQWRLADLAVETSAGRLLTYRSAWSKDEDSQEFLKRAAMCKTFTAKAARLHSGEAMQVLGLLLSRADSEMERAYRNAKMFELCLTANDEEKVLLGRELGI
jgi:alkylation response protein AidB-like acyl-CoA dehydrogenase